MHEKFAPDRLRLARKRRQLTLKALSESVGLTPRMVGEYEKDYCTSIPPKDTVDAFAKALGYPIAFFFAEEKIETIDEQTVSFRSLKAMKASQMHAAISAGSIGLLLDKYLNEKFNNLPKVNLPDLRGAEPETAAGELRESWGLGNHCINNMVHLLEKHGVRVFSLAENTQSVDAFSFWKDDKPYIFLNMQKSGERSRMDAAHELGHLVLHKHGSPQGKDVEADADKFAACFLMPRRTVLACASKYLTVDDILKLRPNWNTSAMSIIMQLRHFGAITEWHHRSLIIEASGRGLRRKEIDGIEREKTLLLDMMFKSLKDGGTSLSSVAKELMLPIEEITNLLFKLGIVHSDSVNLKATPVKPPKLTVIK
ncbi:MAG: Zn-dependent peptidase ImmA (M78 family)/transcriptional regulator with XRE-family HTH domain [Lentisphaeria bacterium]|jgi:Zn-dependent peptidase ImmA (M78 family)/transcriptional regulator with XRE-family HTH domain